MFQPIMMVHFKPFATKQQAEGILVYLYLYICVRRVMFWSRGRDWP